MMLLSIIKRAIVFGIGIFCAASYAQSLTGTVTDSVTGSPIKDATVTLKVLGKATLTDAQGKFSISISAVRQGQKGPVVADRIIALSGSTLKFVVPERPASVFIALYGLSGRQICILANGDYGAGSHAVALPQKSLSAMVRILRCRIGSSEQTYTLALDSIAKGRSLREENDCNKSAVAVADTLLAYRYGYYCGYRNASSYTGNLSIKLKPMSIGAIVPPGMKLIQGNAFMMGSQTGAADETPVHRVILSSYFVDSTEVTQLDFEALIKVRPWDNSVVILPGGKGIYQPAWGVNWYDAVLYCNERSKRDGLDTVYQYQTRTGTPGDGCILDSATIIDYTKNGYRLLTEAEWEYACGGGKSTTFFWGNSVDSANNYTWNYDNSNYASHNVAQKRTNTFGLYDISGNAAEWVNDWQSDNYNPMDTLNPAGPAQPPVNGYVKMFRGSSWFGAAVGMRFAERYFNYANTRTGYIGFRVALPKR